jgi:hypothetical protein
MWRHPTGGYGLHLLRLLLNFESPMYLVMKICIQGRAVSVSGVRRMRTKRRGNYCRSRESKVGRGEGRRQDEQSQHSKKDAREGEGEAAENRLVHANY